MHKKTERLDMLTTDKLSVARLVLICSRLGIEDVIFSPGSRNAPMVIAFVESKLFNTYCIPDERAAAFYALGMSIATKNPTVICCTSGSAVLNYAPAISEAYYQGIPMVVVTADRPVEWIDQGVGQSIRQNEVFRNIIKSSFQFTEEASEEQDLIANDTYTIDAIQTSLNGWPGPVHINIPLQEPLYNQAPFVEHPLIQISDIVEKSVDIPELNRLQKIWKSSRRKIILMGQSTPKPMLHHMLNNWVQNKEVILLTETSSNCYVNGAIQNIDRVITNFGASKTKYQADLLISIGGPIVSKKILSYFLNNKPIYHWHVSRESKKDTFRALTDYIPTEAIDFFKEIEPDESLNELTFQNDWEQVRLHTSLRHNEFINNIAWSDLKLFDIALKELKDDMVLHMGNSTVVRYIQLFNQNPQILYLGNRGVGGIDGCTSTALGYTIKSEKKNILITGDMAFYYDSNAFWNHHFPSYFRIIVVNNQGGGIFRIIPGPSSTHQLKHYFEAYQEGDAHYLAKHNNIDYKSAHNEDELKHILPEFLDDSKGVKMLEIFTPREINDTVLMDYFNYLK